MSRENTNEHSTTEKENFIKNTIKIYKNLNLDLKIFSSKKLKYKTIWTSDEDRLLLNLVNNQNDKDWKKISSYFDSKSAIQCSARYKRINPFNKKGKWSQEEDDLLLRLMKIHGKNWSKITKHFKSRTGKQVRDRYVNVLDPNILKNKFTENEDMVIIELYQKMGTNWAEISKNLHKRTPDMVKNRFYQFLKAKFNLVPFSKKKRSDKIYLNSYQETYYDCTISKNNLRKETSNKSPFDITLNSDSHHIFSESVHKNSINEKFLPELNFSNNFEKENLTLLISGKTPFHDQDSLKYTINDMSFEENPIISKYEFQTKDNLKKNQINSHESSIITNPFKYTSKMASNENFKNNLRYNFDLLHSNSLFNNNENLLKNKFNYQINDVNTGENIHSEIYLQVLISHYINYMEKQQNYYIFLIKNFNEFFLNFLLENKKICEC